MVIDEILEELLDGDGKSGNNRLKAIVLYHNCLLTKIDAEKVGMGILAIHYSLEIRKLRDHFLAVAM